MPTIYFETFGTKIELNSNDLQDCYQQLDNFSGLENVNFLENDICMMVLPKKLEHGKIIFTDLPHYISNNIQHGKFNLFFSETAKTINKRAIHHKPRSFKIRNDGITKFNLYNWIYRSIVPPKTTGLKDSQLIIHQLKVTLYKLLQKTKKIKH
ncbi:hypothetical protein M153_7160002071 [Pseudoloma neurophilia]|uniref:Uncharacterized protein n=1 Tax=Pseudoloma neurophilia TaxID=146866 RepID=A0A0R0M457_9MICR|nr:hypothetical protein M153_7160002071 [Pseudoloma neurophilia]